MSQASNLDLLYLMIDVLSGVMILSGSFFIMVGAIGLIRMPDVFTRMHAVSVIETMGAGLLLSGLMIQAGPTILALKLFLVFVLFFFTAPVATHALAQAALSAGETPQLSEDRRSKPAAATPISSNDNEGADD